VLERYIFGSELFHVLLPQIFLCVVIVNIPLKKLAHPFLLIDILYGQQNNHKKDVFFDFLFSAQQEHFAQFWIKRNE